MDTTRGVQRGGCQTVRWYGWPAEIWKSYPCNGFEQLGGKIYHADKKCILPIVIIELLFGLVEAVFVAPRSEEFGIAT